MRRGTPGDNRDKAWSDAATKQRMPRFGGHPQKLGRGKARFSPLGRRKHGFPETLILDLKPLEQ